MRGRLLALLLFALPLRATVAPTALTGRVTSNGKAVTATITVASPSLPRPRSTVTNEHGTYWLEALPSGTYDVTFAAKGMQTLTRRAVVELARVARCDAALEPGDEEESTTSTATTISVADTQPPTAHAGDAQMDALPLWRLPYDVAGVIGGGFSRFSATELDEVFFVTPYFLGQEGLEEMTVVRGAAPVESPEPNVIVVRTRDGGEAFSFSLRDTLTSTSWIEGPRLGTGIPRDRNAFGHGVDHFFEAAAGGRIVPERLWFFASGWRGDEDDRLLHDVRGYGVKLTAQPTASQTLVGAYNDSRHEVRFGDTRAGSGGSLRYDVTRARTTVEGIVSRGTVTYTPSIFGNGPTALAVEDDVTLKASHLSACGTIDCLFTAGTNFERSSLGDSTTLFGSGRFSTPRLVANAGLRVERGARKLRVRPRLHGAWDLRGDGRRALITSYGDYADPRFPDYSIRELAAGYAFAIGASGTARADLQHRRYYRLSEDARSVTLLHLESSYRLFERFEAGANYEYARQPDERVYGAQQAANGWVGAEFPLGQQALGITLLERYLRYDYGSDPNVYTTDVGVRYRLPLRGLALTAAADVVNVFNDAHALPLALPRTFRFWLRVAR
ncbi:MAG TPA: carboxypeptidase-like regulatory domain-containing protein [Thermoanaerobaculia bacterium]|jgi:hypothetical protein